MLYEVITLPEERTCDKLISGSWDMEVTKIATTFMATVDVIRRAAEAGVNFIITHEPTWFTGMDGTDWLQEDEVYLAKKALIEQHVITSYSIHYTKLYEWRLFTSQRPMAMKYSIPRMASLSAVSCHPPCPCNSHPVAAGN